jgi:hypothetical protein
MKKRSESLLELALVYIFVSCVFHWKSFAHGTPSSIAWQLCSSALEAALFVLIWMSITIWLKKQNH